jgi:hypothetical protein
MEDFYIYDYKVLFDNWYNIFPNKNMSRNELFNSLTRFGGLLIILFYIINSTLWWYIIPFVLIIVSLFAGFKDEEINDENSKKDKQYDIKKRCRLPTNNNPYMNLLVNDSNVDLPACEYDKKLVDSKYKFNLYQNSNDLFDKKNLERQFYTMPITTIPNNTIEFGKWLYNTSGNCKYDGTRCLQYEDERYH